MEHKKIIIGGLVIGIILISGFWIFAIYSHSQSRLINQAEKLKRDCINAAIRGIELDIKRHQKWIEAFKEKSAEEDKQKEKIKSRLNKLKAELKKYKNIRLQDYKLPEKKEIIGWTNGLCRENSILQTENMTRSGPFYHIVGIKGGNYNVIKPRAKYKMIIYLVYPRYYPFPDYYIYIDKYEQI